MAVWTSDLKIYEIGGSAAIGAPPFALRDLVQTIEPISQSASLARAVSGKLRNLSPVQFRLLRIGFACTDQQIPPLLWPGDERTIECVMPIGHLTSGGTALRTARSTLNDDSPALDDGDGTFVDGDWTFTRMKIDVMVVEPMAMSFGEWAAEATWTIVFEEIGGS